MSTCNVQILVSNTILQKGESGLLGGIADSRAGAGNRTLCSSRKKGSPRTSLVAQWLRIRLPMQGTRV